MADGYGSEYAVVLPQGDSVQTLQWALTQRQRLEQEKQLRDKQMRDQQEGLASYIDNTLDYKNFATGTVADPTVIHGLSDLRQKYAAMIRDNPGIGISGLMYNMQQDVNKINTYSANAKLIRDNIEKSVAEYGKEPGLDGDALRKGAIRSAFTKLDPTTGQVVVNDADLDPSKDYVADYLNRYPEKVVTGPEGLTKAFADAKTTGYSDVLQTDNKGVKRKIKVTADLLPHQELEYKNGRPVGTKFQTQDVTFEDKSTAKGLSDAGIQEYFAKPAAKAVLAMAMKQQYPNVLPGNPDYSAVVKKVALDVANQYTRGGKFQSEDVTDQDAWRAKQQAGITINTGEKEKKENVFQVLKNIKAGDLSYIADQTPDANGLIDITSALPNGILYSGRIKKTTDGTATKEAFDAVYYNPLTKSFFTKDERDKKNKQSPIVPIPADQEKKIFQKLAEANGVPVKKFLEIWDGVKQDDSPLPSFPGSNLLNRVLGRKTNSEKTPAPKAKSKSGVNWE